MYKDIGGKPKLAPKKQLSVNKCLGLIRDLLHAEMVEDSFDYFRMLRQCWRLLRAASVPCQDGLIRIYGPDYIERESQRPFVIGYVLMWASSAQELGDLMPSKRPGV
ncbi:hypothetical protein DPSP01_010158 [Paraphaeosphaeria sporulosa]|uniref:Uncharacterized protein n=1 Tax=Paraphaeosphaeria sporulosa TaxID=1460663 RepID=A0A177D0I8_9PLEO|nr:uncharacterized protein CC84DRAFT_1171324 [Paraphaeosphaeria sporulosa]OAG12640.1 hypothetical protein CC84DRAFT_1171324 [Paraphaeosphaeria sporulosa]